MTSKLVMLLTTLLALNATTLAKTLVPPSAKRSHHPMSTVLWSPPPGNTLWNTDEAPLGDTTVPFVFSGNTLYTDTSFESKQNIQIQQQASIHTSGDTTLHLSGQISSNPANNLQGLAKYGPGTLKLSGHNTYSGPTVLHEGTLSVVGNSALSTSHHTLHMHSGTTLSYADQAQLYNNIQLQPGSQPEHTVTLRVDQGSATQYGDLFTLAPISKQGAGRLHLAGWAFMPALATIEQGSLAIDGLYAGPIHVRHGARLEGTGFVGSALVQSGGTLAPGFNQQASTMQLGSL